MIAVSRFLASLLLALFGFSLISPALLADADSNLPACCRRAGVHHCLLTNRAPTGPAFNVARCPNFPGVRAVPAAAKLAGLVQTSRAVFASTVSHPTTHAQSEALYRISYNRAGQKRGPPIFLS
jgi:hypothetical protein